VPLTLTLLVSTEYLPFHRHGQLGLLSFYTLQQATTENKRKIYA